MDDTILTGELLRADLNKLPWSEFCGPLQSQAELQQGPPSLSFILVIGTWCGDTQEHLPAFLSLLDHLRVREEQVKIYGVDRTKRLPGITDVYQIEKLPTFIVLGGGRELGRITETPTLTLFADLALILKNHQTLHVDRDPDSK